MSETFLFTSGRSSKGLLRSVQGRRSGRLDNSCLPPTSLMVFFSCLQSQSTKVGDQLSCNTDDDCAYLGELWLPSSFVPHHLICGAYCKIVAAVHLTAAQSDVLSYALTHFLCHRTPRQALRSGVWALPPNSAADFVNIRLTSVP